MGGMRRSRICAVANSQLEERLLRYASLCKYGAEIRVGIVPFHDARLVTLTNLLAEHGPLALYLLVGKYGKRAVAKAALHSVVRRDVARPKALREVNIDSDLEGKNVLVCSDLKMLKQSIAIERFILVSSEEPLKTGRWHVATCTL